MSRDRWDKCPGRWRNRVIEVEGGRRELVDVTRDMDDRPGLVVPPDTRASDASTGVNGVDEYSALRVAFATWLLDLDRTPATQKEWAEQHGIAEETASRWRQHPEVVAIVSTWRERLRAELGRVMTNMVRIASTGDGMPSVQAAKLLADLYGELSPTRIQHEVTLAAYLAGRINPQRDSGSVAVGAGSARP
jgi:hypothetical protein